MCVCVCDHAKSIDVEISASHLRIRCKETDLHISINCPHQPLQTTCKLENERNLVFLHTDAQSVNHLDHVYFQKQAKNSAFAIMCVLKPKRMLRRPLWCLHVHRIPLASPDHLPKFNS